MQQCLDSVRENDFEAASCKGQIDVETLIHHRVQLARQGSNPTVICRVLSGWIVLGDVQFLRGYSLLMPDPVVTNFNALSGNRRNQFLQDMAMLGDALLEVTGANRINYEILGNSEPALHAHVFPRYETEAEEQRQKPVWFYDRRNAPEFNLERDQPLMSEIAETIKRYRSNLTASSTTI